MLNFETKPTIHKIVTVKLWNQVSFPFETPHKYYCDKENALQIPLIVKVTSTLFKTLCFLLFLISDQAKLFHPL